MKEDIIKWINKNAVDVRQAGITLLIINLLLVAFCMMSGQFGWLFLHLINIVFADIFMALPMVFLVKFVKELK
jgi:hypothetical protein